MAPLSEPFADAEAAGSALSPLVVDWLASDRASTPVVLVDLAAAGLSDPIARATALPVIPVITGSTAHADLRVRTPSDADRALLASASTCIVVDRGVETGRRALAVARWIDDCDPHASGAGRTLLLAVGVCPRQALPALEQRYAHVIAIHRPLARRALRWHFADLS